MGNIDITIIAEKPKISPHKQKILDNLYSILKTPADTINVKVGFSVALPSRQRTLNPERRAWWSHLVLDITCQERNQSLLSDTKKENDISEHLVVW